MPEQHSNEQNLVLTYTFPNCWVHVDEAGTFLHTAFRSGRVLESVPNLGKDYRTAADYGYGEDIWRLWREHDVLHHLVGTFFGHGHSPTIWSVAHEDSPEALPRWAQLQEEIFVRHVHRWLNLGEWHPDLWPLNQVTSSLSDLYAGMQSVLRGEIMDARVFAPTPQAEAA